MSTTTLYPPRRNRVRVHVHAWLRRARPLLILAFSGAAIVGGNEALNALQSPGQAIRSELIAAAAELVSPAGPYPTEATTRSIRRHFHEHSVALQTNRWPVVSVTLHHVDKATCVDASIAARRIEGLVVIELEGYRSVPDCSPDNTMTWRLLP